MLFRSVVELLEDDTVGLIAGLTNDGGGDGARVFRDFRDFYSGVCSLRVTPFQSDSAISQEQLMRGVEKSLRKYFGKRGERVVQDNLKAVQRGYEEVFEIPRDVMLSTAAEDDRNAALRVM